ncbi:MAG TPA: flavin reductase family protein [Acidimicrobiia bacterium]|nr:flavin reductase family protein [Acidimicrobiia bacterium]
MSGNGPTRAFECIVQGLEYPMFVVAAAADGDADACLVGFTTQCSMEPPRFAAFLSKSNRTYEIATRATVLVVHRIRPDQHELAEHFGGTSEKDDPAKLAEWPWRPGPGGVPVIEECDWFAGTIEARLDAGDHVAFVLAPFDGRCRDDGQLGYQEVRDIDAGQPPGEPD